jgi:hypothetical protein
MAKEGNSQDVVLYGLSQNNASDSFSCREVELAAYLAVASSEILGALPLSLSISEEAVLVQQVVDFSERSCMAGRI